MEHIVIIVSILLSVPVSNKKNYFLDDIGGTDKNIALAQSLDVHCVGEDFLEEVEKGGALLMIPKKSIASWGGNVSIRRGHCFIRRGGER